MRPFFFLLMIIFACPACCESGPSHFQGGKPGNEAEEVTEVAMEAPSGQKSLALAEDGASPSPVASQVANPSMNEAEKIPALIIKNADIRFQVADLEKSIGAVQKAVSQSGGYVASSSESRGGELSVNLSLRVPAAQFEKLLDEVLK